MNELIEALALYVPRIVGAFALLVLGFVLAVLAKRITPFLLRRVRFDQVCERAGVTNLMHEGGIERVPSQLAGVLVFYAVLALAIVTTTASLGLDVLAGTINQIFLYAPRALVAIMTLILASRRTG